MTTKNASKPAQPSNGRKTKDKPAVKPAPVKVPVVKPANKGKTVPTAESAQTKPAPTAAPAVSPRERINALRRERHVSTFKARIAVVIACLSKAAEALKSGQLTADKLPMTEETYQSLDALWSATYDATNALTDACDSLDAVTMMDAGITDTVKRGKKVSLPV